jgi:hypothetical protein
VGQGSCLPHQALDNGATMSRETIKPLIVGAILVAIFLVLKTVLPPLLEPETAQWVSFFATLVAILSGYICFIAFMSRLLSGRISERVFGYLEKLLIAGILLGIAGMFQPWVPVFYPLGFIVLFAATWIFTLWGYVVPKSAHGTE